MGRALAPLAGALVRAGLKRVDGALIADETYFRGPALGAGWDWDDLEFGYAAPVSALSVNENVVALIASPGPAAGRPARLEFEPPCRLLSIRNGVITTETGGRDGLTVRRALGSSLVEANGGVPLNRTSITETVSVPRPAEWMGELLATELQRRGVTIRRGVRHVSAPSAESTRTDLATLLEIASVESPPLAELLPLMMKPSQNLRAQLWLLQCGVAWERKDSSGGPFPTTERAGLAAMTNFLSRVGVGAREVMFEEGTGLSRRNLVTPRAVVALLRYMASHPAAGVFRDSLPVAGRDGTLRSRMRGTAAADNARAKTGYLAFTYALSGYVTTRAGERLVFALLLNNYQTPDPDRPARLELDDIVVALAGLASRTSASSPTPPQPSLGGRVPLSARASDIR
jgi:D-alanyl-D-alanine carboxypeptidase/D-alanyl-D-alanine-endopeptidase (penicillin-binding protein 4)